MQAADRSRDRTLTEAHAAATEFIGQARAEVAAIAALSGHYLGDDRANLIDQLYRERIASIADEAAVSVW